MDANFPLWKTLGKKTCVPFTRTNCVLATFDLLHKKFMTYRKALITFSHTSGPGYEKSYFPTVFLAIKKRR